ncbi:MAG: cytochrome-c peroxidase [Crocinitomicaceae bacterium]|nr:cytochrome-c peroxidase [Crocinitomicaceae bacterium]
MKNIAALVILWMVLLSCGSEQPKETKPKTVLKDYKKTAEVDLLTEAKRYFLPLPEEAVSENNPLTKEKVDLGKKLFFDKRLSKDQNISCNSCHNLETYGVDNLPTSPGDEGKNGDRNSPTVLNAALHFSQFWDGRAADVEEQAGGPILNPVEMNIPSKEFMVKRLEGVKEYVSMFNAAFPNEKISYENLQLAIGAFERKLLTPSKFDQYLKGNENALNKKEKEGLKLFINTGCITCHSGEAVGGNMFQKFGLHGDYWEKTKSDPVDDGRFKETQNEADRYVFKVPSLRNIEKTYPYFHDGSISDLKEAVIIMAQLQNNKTITSEEAESIVTFLKTLTGEVPIVGKTPA